MPHGPHRLPAPHHPTSNDTESITGLSIPQTRIAIIGSTRGFLFVRDIGVDARLDIHGITGIVTIATRTCAPNKDYGNYQSNTMSLGDQPRKGIAGVRFQGAIAVRSAYSLPQALVGFKEWTDPDVMFESDILGPDDSQALELAKNIRKRLVHTYKHLRPLMEVKERHAFGDRSFFAENDIAEDMDEEIQLNEDS